MKNLKLLKARLVLITAFLAVAVSTMFLAAFPAAEKTVSASTDELTLKINYKNLSYSDQTYILYAVEYAGLYADSAEVELLFWRSTDGGLNKGSEDYSESERYTQKIGGKTHHVFYSHGIAPKNLVDDIYCRAYAVINGKEYYSETLKYSGLQYLKNMIAKTADTTEEYALYTALLNYAAAAQNKFDYKTDTLATDDFVNISVSGGTLSDGFTYGLIKHSAVVTIVADLAPQGSQFKHWTDGDGNVLGTSETLEYAFDQNVTVIAEYETAATEGLNYVVSKDGEGYAISGIDFGNVATVVIPTYYNGIPVTEIAVNAFKDNAALTSVIIPDGVKAIASGAFSGCLNMETVCVPSDLKAIGESAFKNCAELSEIVIPDSVTEIGANAFTGCDSLTSVTIPENVKSVGGGAFSDCDDLTNIDWNAWDCETAGSYSEPIFAGNDSVNTVTIGENVQKIPDNLFKDLASVTEIVIPDSVTEIGANAFTGCESLQTLVIPESVSAIGDFVASGCVSLDKICFKGSLSAWADITIGDNNPLFVKINVYFYIEIEPVAEGKFWRIVNGEIVVYVIVHDYKQQITEPTCTEQGYTTYVCSRCGDEYVDNYISALGHNYENGVCTRCGEPDPDYVAPAFTQGLAYGLNPGGTSYSVTGIGTATDTDIIIPATYEGKPVTRIADSAFNGCSRLKSINIPDSVMIIYDFAFSYCSKLTSIVIPNSVTSIGNRAFQNCRCLASIIVENDNAKYKSENNCLIEKSTNKLILGCKNSVIPNGVTSIDSYAFCGCRDLTSIIIPDGVTNIGQYAFDNCSSLASVSISDSVTSIGYYAFIDCSSLTSVYYAGEISDWCDIDFDGNGANPMSYRNFYLKENGEYKLVTDLIIPDTVTEIKQYAFCGCVNSISVKLGNNVKTIGEGAFWDCRYLTNIIISNSVESIGYYAFYYCSKLTTVYYEGTESDWSNIDLCSDNDYFTNATRYYYSETQPDAEGNFWHYVNGEIVVWQPYVAPAFTQGLAFTHIYGGGYSVSGIGTATDTDIIIPATHEGEPVTRIGFRAFKDCGDLTSVNIPDSIASLEMDAFRDCVSLKSVILSESSQLASIGDYAFSGCSSLTSIEIPYSVVSMGNSVFYGCSSLKNINIPDGVNIIGYGVFCQCSSLVSINIPDGVTSIGYNAFLCCSRLTSINIPDGVTSIGGMAFWGCNNLTTVYYGGTESGWLNIEISNNNDYLTSATRYYYSETQPDVEGNFWHYANGEIVVWQPYVAPAFTQGLIYELNSDGASYSVTGIGTATDVDVIIPATYEGKPVTKIGDNAFKDVYSLTNVNIPNSVTSIGAHAFDYCGNLKSITIPDSVTIIGDSAFESCFSLTSVTFGQDCALESIGGSAFFCCGLTEIVIPNSVTNIGLWAFMDCGIRSVSFEENSRLEKIRGAFFSCGALTSVNIPASVTSIEYGAFEMCDNITTVYYGGTESDWAEINIDLMFSDEFKNATRYYYSETQPDAEGNFWHYVNGEIVVW